MDDVRPVLVTGGAGFIGSHLVDALLTAGYRVVVVDDLSLGRIDYLAAASGNPQFSFEQLDMRDRGAVFALVDEQRPQAVFHMAANSDIMAGNDEPAIDLERTFGTTIVALEAAVRGDVRDFLFASSSAVYGETPAGELIPETYGPLAPISYYGAAKAAGEAFVSAFGHQHDLRTRVARFPNVVGGRATHGVIFDFIRKLKRDPSQLEVLGDGTQCKTYLLVDDLVDGLLFVWRQIAGVHSVVHIGTSGTTAVRRIAEMVVAQVAPEARITYTGGDRGWKGDVPYFSYVTSTLDELGWRAAHDSDQSVQEAVERIAGEQGL